MSRLIDQDFMQLYTDIKKEIPRADAKLMMYISWKFPSLAKQNKESMGRELWEKLLAHIRYYMTT